MLKVDRLDYSRGRRFLVRLRPSFEVGYEGTRPWTSRRLRKSGGGHRWHGGGAIGRFRDVFRVLSRTAQAGGIRRPVFLLGLGILVWLFKDHFLFGAHNLLATDLHGLHTHHLVGHDTDKVHILRRIAIDPFFIFGFAISLPHFFRRLALGVQHHFRIHSNQHTVRLNGLFHLRRHGIQIRLLFVSRIEIEHR